MKFFLILLLVSCFYLERGFAQIDSTNSPYKFSFGIAPIKILNNKFSIVSQFIYKKHLISTVVDFQIKYIPFKKPLILDYNDFNKYIKLTLIYERKFWASNKYNLAFGIAPTVCFNYTKSKQTLPALVTQNSYAISNIYDERNFYYGLLLNSSYSIKLGKSFFLRLVAQVGPVKDRLERTNIKNPINDENYKNLLIHKIKLNYELLATINYTF